MADRKLTVKCIFKGNNSTKCDREWILGSTDYDFPAVNTLLYLRKEMPCEFRYATLDRGIISVLMLESSRNLFSSQEKFPLLQPPCTVARDSAC